MKIAKVEDLHCDAGWRTFSFLKVTTDDGLVGWSEFTEADGSRGLSAVIHGMAEDLIGQDPRPIQKIDSLLYVKQVQAPNGVNQRAIAAIENALLDIKGKALGVPVYELLGGPTRNKVRVYAHASVDNPDSVRKAIAQGFTAFKTGPAKKHPARFIESPSAVAYAGEKLGEFRKLVGPDIDIAVDFHGAISPAHAKMLIKAMEPYTPMFIEEPCQAQNHDVMAEIARSTFLPIATGERVFTKWGFREVLEKKAAVVLQPDLCHAGGITEVRLIAGMAEAYYATIAPHNPLGPISLAAGVQIAASIPNFLIQEQVSLGEGYVKQPFTVSGGYLNLPTAPGLGVELDENALANKLGHDWKNPEAYDADDGSVVDW